FIPLFISKSTNIYTSKTYISIIDPFKLLKSIGEYLLVSLNRIGSPTLYSFTPQITESFLLVACNNLLLLLIAYIPS
ncbi:hypothetical protein Q0N58_14790, partial [Staphylococcus aureus]|nr:hypothetical protein [Staphylococcus aureus]